MKKLVTLLITLLSALLLTSAAAQEPADFAGHWQLLLMQTEDKFASPADMNLDLTLHLREDGLCTISSGSISETLLWAVTEDGALLSFLNGTSIPLTLFEGALIAEVGSVQLILAPLTEDTAATAVAARPLSGLSLSDFEGRWTFTHAESSFDAYPAAELETSISLTIADGSARIETTTPYGTDVLEAACTLQEVSLPDCPFTLLWASARGCDSIPLLRYEDGLLVWYHYDRVADREYFYCFSPAE